MKPKNIDILMLLGGYLVCPLIAYGALEANEVVGAILTLPLGFLLVYCGDLRAKARKARQLIGQKQDDDSLGPDPIN